MIVGDWSKSIICTWQNHCPHELTAATVAGQDLCKIKQLNSLGCITSFHYHQRNHLQMAARKRMFHYSKDVVPSWLIILQ